ncbi:MAG: hypothetical protein NVS1B14_11880 [Vulcanimicrobiaceae bacterium]
MPNTLDHTVLKIDALLRQATALMWEHLPPAKRVPEELQNEALRVMVRVVSNFADDLAVFTHDAQREASDRGAKARERFPNSGRSWTPETDEELRRLFQSGNAINDLSLYFQRTENGIRGRLVKLGLLDAKEFRSRFAA